MPLSQIGYYRVDRLLGAGGMGAVYEATHSMTGRRVAVKTLRSELADRADLNARFFNEARTMSFLEHPGIVRVFDVGRTDDGTAYMVMELCAGPTLGAAMRERIDLPSRIALLAPVADALAYAHTQGVIHRDLKPDNVIVTPTPTGPQPKVLDFGIAKVLDGASAANSPFAVKTRTGTAMGTPLYMSPEQCRGMGGITRATDVYSFGIMLYEAIAGRVPFNGGVGEVIVQHLTTPVPDFEDETVVDTRAHVKAIVYAMLEKDAATRPDMAEVARTLRAYLAEPHPHSLIPETPEPPRVDTITKVARKAAPMTASTDTMAARADTRADETGAPAEETVRPASRAPAGRRAGVAVALLGGAGAVAIAAWALWPVSPPATRLADGGTVASADLGSPRAPAATRPWRIDSVPSGADLFGADGALVGRTPFDASTTLARGIDTLYVRRAGYRDELVKYEGSGASEVHLKARTHTKPAPLPARTPSPAKTPSPASDDFDVQPVK